MAISSRLQLIYYAISAVFGLAALLSAVAGLGQVVVDWFVRRKLADSVSFLLRIGGAEGFEYSLVGSHHYIFGSMFGVCLVLHIGNFVATTLMKRTPTAVLIHMVLAGLTILLGVSGAVMSGVFYPKYLSSSMDTGMKSAVGRHFGAFVGNSSTPENVSLGIVPIQRWNSSAQLHKLQISIGCCGRRGWSSYAYWQYHIFETKTKNLTAFKSLQRMYSCCRPTNMSDCLHDKTDVQRPVVYNKTHNFSKEQVDSYNSHFQTEGCPKAILKLYHRYTQVLIWSFSIMASTDFVDLLISYLLMKLLAAQLEMEKTAEGQRLLTEKEEESEDEENEEEPNEDETAEDENSEEESAEDTN